LYRVAASGYLSQSRKEVHLLGCNEDPETLKLCEEINPNVRSCDSAYAYLCAKASMNEITLHTLRPEGHIDFLNGPRIGTLPKLMEEMEDIVR
jgi:hypothetical protein